MFPLRALLDRHPTLLLIDTASSHIQIGLLRRSEAPLWTTAAAEAGGALFSLTEQLLRRAATSGAPLPLSAVDAFIFCDGPGSVLGIRTAAIALRTWAVLHPRPAYAITSLAHVAHDRVRRETLREFSVISDARRDAWHRVTVDHAGNVSGLSRTPTSALTGTLILPENFRTWSALPPSVRRIPYDLATSLPALADEPLFREAPAPDAFLHEEPSYQTWTPQVHRAPA